MTSAPILAARDLRKRFGGVLAVNDASFEVAPQSITALIGPNGAGKTTMFNLLSGFLRPDGGAIEFEGRRCDGQPSHALAAAGLVRTFQIPRVLTRMTVLENMMLAGTGQPGEALGAALLRPRRVARRENEIREQARETLTLIRLDRLAHDYAGTLSGGQRKLLEFGRALMTQPRLLLLDEPMAGVAPALALQLLEHIVDLRATRGTTFLVIEHDMEMVMAIGDRIVVMDEGAVIADGPPGEIQRNERVIAAYLGEHGRAAPASAAAQP
ncbi:MAG TPA: ABC transporter ATP-binding protein [Thermomicrobiales bacterium]|nr:ABC transporter ATP-binding protein [Thermomicrobiales bacterium]